MIELSKQDRTELETKLEAECLLDFSHEDLLKRAIGKSVVERILLKNYESLYAKLAGRDATIFSLLKELSPSRKKLIQDLDGSESLELGNNNNEDKNKS